MRFAAARRDPFDRIPIEAREHRSAEPAPFESDDPVGEVSARFQHRQAGFDRGAVYLFGL